VLRPHPLPREVTEARLPEAGPGPGRQVGFPEAPQEGAEADPGAAACPGAEGHPEVEAASTGKAKADSRIPGLDGST